MSEPPYQWTSTENIEPLGRPIRPLAPREAKALFLERFAELWD